MISYIFLSIDKAITNKTHLVAALELLIVLYGLQQMRIALWMFKFPYLLHLSCKQ